MATHSSILAWRIPWMEELGGLQSTCHKESDTTERLHFSLSLQQVNKFSGKRLVPEDERQRATLFLKGKNDRVKADFSGHMDTMRLYKQGCEGTR